MVLEANSKPRVAPVFNRCGTLVSGLCRRLCCLPRLATVMLCAAGCRPVDTRFQVVTFRDPAHPETLSEHFQPGSFALNAGKNYEIVFEIPPAPIRPALPDKSDQNDELAEADPLWVSQIIHIEVFWRPLPGTTYAESTQTNANVLYCVATGENVISYEGAGFVYLDISRDGQHLRGRLESSTLFPARFVKAPTDLFGPCRVTGIFQAVCNRRDVANVQQTLHRLLGPPVAPSLDTSES